MIRLKRINNCKADSFIQKKSIEEVMKQKNIADQTWTFVIGCASFVSSIQYAVLAAYYTTFSKKELDGQQAWAGLYTLLFTIDVLVIIIKSFT